MKFRVGVVVCILAVGNLAFPMTGSDSQVIFEATIEKIGDLPPISCGVMFPYQLAKYRVEKVYVGVDLPKVVVVDHLACNNGEMLRGLKQGNKVIVIAKIKKALPQRYNAVGIRTPDEKVRLFYVAERVACMLPC